MRGGEATLLNMANSFAKGKTEVTIDPGDISIGAVEVKDGVTDNRLTVNTDGSINVNVNDETASEPVYAFGEDLAVVPSTETTLATYTVPALKTFHLKHIVAEGNDDGIFRVYKNSTKVWQGRNAWTERVISSDVDVVGNASDVFTLKVVNTRATNRAYSGALYGTEL